MGEMLRLRITAIWLLLLLATLSSWAAANSFGWGSRDANVATAVVIVAFAKVRFILLDFMELRQAPLPLRLFAEAWTVVVCAAILILYWTDAGRVA